MDDREERIRRRAHQIWEEEGRPVGQEADHWRRAAQEIDGERGRAGNGGDIARGGLDPEAMATAPGGLGTGLQPGGTKPGGGPAAGAGSIGIGGASAAGKPAANRKRTKR